MTRIQLRYLILALTLALSASALAKPRSENITLYHDATVNGTALPAGDYVVKYETEGNNAQVKFMKGNKEVATATGQVKTLSKKSPSNQVLYTDQGSTHSISEIDFGGKETGISFEASSTSMGK